MVILPEHFLRVPFSIYTTVYIFPACKSTELFKELLVYLKVRVKTIFVLVYTEVRIEAVQLALDMFNGPQGPYKPVPIPGWHIEILLVHVS